jgi:hypothetical protein
MSTLSVPFAQRLFRRTPLPLSPARGVAIKRNVHEIEIGADAARFADAFAEVLSERGARFGLITVKRTVEHAGRAFTVGERFSGCLKLQDAAGRLGPGSLGRLVAALGRSRLGAWLEDALLSDYAEIAEIDLAPPAGAPYRVVYRYLSGSPIAGSSTFLVEPVEAGRCRLRVVFEYQEVGGLAISVLHRFGVQLHDEVTYVQAMRAAERAGAVLLSSTIRQAIKDRSGTTSAADHSLGPAGPGARDSSSDRSPGSAAFHRDR